ncbi:MAG: SUMF1/EgtB/PvdO family nonheme iron enzyme [Polyangiaceae bacterium]
MAPPLRFVLAGTLAVSALSGCNPDTTGTSSGAPAASGTAALIEADEDEAVDAGSQQKGAAKAAGERVEIPAGKLVAGSVPGDRGRDPALEPALLEVELGAFSIDKLPHPNDPARAPTTGVSRDKAASLCGEAGGRLCTELEWERACRGPEGTRYAGGAKWEPECAKSPETCASAFGVLAMGGAIREWTSSDVDPIKNLIKGGAAVRGAGADAADVDHRCAHRSVVNVAATESNLGFRCCYGDPSPAKIASPDWEDTIKRVEISTEKLTELFASNPRLAPYAKDIKYFREEAAEDTIMRRGRARGTDAGALPENTYLTTSPVMWNPVPGEHVLLVVGRSGEKDAFIVAFHEVPGGRYRVGSALLMKDEVGPVAIVYNPFVRRKLHWTSCWECYGETGNITYREENRVVITQQ